jgi:hypothetical protein
MASPCSGHKHHTPTITTDTVLVPGAHMHTAPRDSGRQATYPSLSYGLQLAPGSGRLSHGPERGNYKMRLKRNCSVRSPAPHSFPITSAHPGAERQSDCLQQVQPEALGHGFYGNPSRLSFSSELKMISNNWRVQESTASNRALCPFLQALRCAGAEKTRFRREQDRHRPCWDHTTGQPLGR